MAYNDGFVYDPKRHKGFVKTMRYPVVGSFEVSASVKSKTPAPALTLSKEQEALLRLGLSAFDMDFRWVGNLTDSAANASKGERVVRLYRSWTGALIFEARYRPASGSNANGKLVLHEFAHEGDPATYNQPGTTGPEHAKEYQEILEGAVLNVIMARIRNPKYPH